MDTLSAKPTPAKPATRPVPSWHKILTESGRFPVRQVRESDLPVIAELEDEIYGSKDERIDGEGLRAWWDVYPFCAWLMEWKPKANEDKWEIIGVIGIYPVTPDTHKLLMESAITEDQFTGGHLQGGLKIPNPKQHPYWYIGGVETVYKGHPFVCGAIFKRMLKNAVGRWLYRPEVADELEITAVGYTPQGEALLRHNKFEPVGGKPWTWCNRILKLFGKAGHEHLVFHRKAPKKEIQQEIEAGHKKEIIKSCTMQWAQRIALATLAACIIAFITTQWFWDPEYANHIRRIIQSMRHGFSFSHLLELCYAVLKAKPLAQITLVNLLLSPLIQYSRSKIVKFIFFALWAVNVAAFLIYL